MAFVPSLSPSAPPAGPLGALASLLGHGAPPPAAPPAQAGPLGGSEAEPITILRQMIDLANRYMSVEPDQEDVATMSKLHATLQGYLAKDQRDRDTALGNGSVSRLVRKAP